jgi:hypothetical protein
MEKKIEKLTTEDEEKERLKKCL